MPRIKIELVPFGDESMATTIDQWTIANTVDHPRRPEWGNYTAELPELDGITTVHVADHRRVDGARELVRRVLEQYKQQTEGSNTTTDGKTTNT